MSGFRLCFQVKCACMRFHVEFQVDSGGSLILIMMAAVMINKSGSGVVPFQFVHKDIQFAARIPRQYMTAIIPVLLRKQRARPRRGDQFVQLHL